MNTKNYNKNKTPQMKTVGKTSKPKIDKNQLLAIVLAGLIIFWTVASVFGFIGYARSKKPTAKNNVIQASAQTLDNYIQNDNLTIYLFYLDGLTFKALSGTGFIDVTLPYIDMIISHDSISFSSGSSIVTPAKVGQAFAHHTLNVTGLVSTSTSNRYTTGALTLDVSQSNPRPMINIEDFTLIEFIELSYEVFYNDIYDLAEYSQFYVQVGVNIYYGDTSNIYYFDLIYNMNSILNDNNKSFYLPAVSYLGTTGIYRKTAVPAYGFPTADFLKYYKYYTTVSPDAGRNYDLGYNQGKTDGLTLGKEAGRAEGLQQGYANGKAEGDAMGYERGLADGKRIGANDANTYTFDKLLSSVIDVPIRAFSGLFNFDILGINLSTFFFSLLSLAIVLAVVRMVL